MNRAFTTALAVMALGHGLPSQTASRWLQTAWVRRQQEPAGNWSAARGSGRATADLRVTALLLLAKLGEGSVFNDFRSLERGVQWLRGQQDKKGRIGLRPDAEWLLDHAMATAVLAEALRTAWTPQLCDSVVAAVDALRRQIGSMRPSADVELRLWCDMVVRSLRRAVAARAAGEISRAITAAADALEASVAALPAVAAVSPRQQAARWLREVLAGGKGKAVSDKIWCDDPLRDPLTSFYAFAARYVGGGKDFVEAGKAMAPGLRAREVQDGEHEGSLEPTGDWGAENGRLGTTAAAMLLLQIYYRYSHLEIFQ